MNKKKSLLKLATFLVAIAPIMALTGGKFFLGEPKLPAKMQHRN